MEIARIPVMKFMVQSVSFPGLSLPEVEQGSPFLKINQAGDHVIYDDFTFTFLIDEKMNNYRCLQYWIEGLGFPDKYKRFEEFIKSISPDPNFQTFSQNPMINQFSDITVTILTNHKNPQFTYRFKDAFPTNLSGFEASVDSTDSTPIIATATMKFTGMEIDPA
jgi:hypothetical protein